MVENKILFKREVYLNLTFEDYCINLHGIFNDNQKTLDQEVRKTLDQEVQKTLDQEVQKTLNQEVQKTMDQEVQKALDQEVQKTLNQEVRKTLDQEVRKTLDQFVVYLDSSYDFKQSDEHEAQQLCSVNRPFLPNK